MADFLKLERNPLKLPSDVEFYEDIRLLIWRPRGLLNETAVNEVTSVLADLEAKMTEPFDRFSDTLATDEVELNFRHIIHVSLYRRLTYAGRQPVKSAILAADSTIIHYAKLHALMTQGSPIKAQVFHEREAAARWLGVPIERLAATSRPAST
ncbi:MAG TPA: hypothetical protein VM717_05790 [Chthoniobacterales bacterium]|nr:hypothetical protein [Chthoniobacterales bacterium]